MNNEQRRKSSPRKGPNAIVEKPKNLKDSFKKLLVYLKPFIPVLIIALILSAF